MCLKLCDPEGVTHRESDNSRRNGIELSPRLADLAGVAAWSGGLIERLGPVVARSAYGFTQRANSATVVDHDYIAACGGNELDALVRQIERWYGARDEPVRWQVSGPDEAIASAMRRAGYTAAESTLVYVRPASPAATDSVRGPARRVRIDAGCSDAWFDTWHDVSGRTVDSSVSRGFLEQIRGGQWVSAATTTGDDRDCASVGLGIDVEAPDARVICCMATRHGARRQGLASSVLDALLDSNAVCVLQVGQDNPARHLYEARGFVKSHEYRYYEPARRYPL